MFVRVITHREMRRRRIFHRFQGLAFVSGLAFLFAYGIIRETSPAGFVPLGRESVVAARTADRLGIPRPPVGPDLAPLVGPYKPGPGPYAVAEVADLLLHDDARDDNLHVHILYPNAGGPYPVVVFSQGAATPDACCDSLLRHWASYGYVTLEPRPNEGAAGKPVSYDLQGRLFDSARYIMQNPTLWDSRPKDISFLLNSLQEISELLPSFRDKMDAARTGMSGHLLGAYITEVIAGARVDLPGQPGTDASSQASFADRRIRAALALSPLGPGQLGLTESSWDAVAIPYMGVIGSIDTVGHSASPCWCRAPFELSQPGDKYQVVIRGADELSLVARRSPTARYVAKPQSALDDVECATLAFWDAYLKGDPAAKRYLGSDALAKYSNGTVSIERR